MSFISQKSVFAFGVHDIFFVEFFLVFSPNALFTFSSEQNRFNYKTREHIFISLPNQVEQQKIADFFGLRKKRNTTTMGAGADRNKKVVQAWKAKVGSKNKETNDIAFGQRRVKGCRCGLNSTSNWDGPQIWVTQTHTHTHRLFVYWETCTLSQHFFLLLLWETHNKVLTDWRSSHRFHEKKLFIPLLTQTHCREIKPSSVLMKTPCITTDSGNSLRRISQKLSLNLLR